MMTGPRMPMLPVARQRGEGKDYWSEDGQIFFAGGKGYGLTEKLSTICLGDEADIQHTLDTGDLTKGLSNIQIEVLQVILELREEAGIGDFRTSDIQRGNNNGAARVKPKATRCLKAREGISLRLSRKNGKSLLG